MIDHALSGRRGRGGEPALGRRRLRARRGSEERLELGNGPELPRRRCTARQGVVPMDLPVADGALKIAHVGEDELAAIATLNDPANSYSVLQRLQVMSIVCENGALTFRG
jgi:hypothetical protein